MTDQDISRSLCEIVIDERESFISHVVARLVRDLEDQAVDPTGVTAYAVSTLVEAFAMPTKFAETLVDQVQGSRRTTLKLPPEPLARAISRANPPAFSRRPTNTRIR